MKRIGFYSPYLDQLGGGERYLLGIAEYFLKKGDQVDIFWPTGEILKDFQTRFNFNPKNKPEIVGWPFGPTERLKYLKIYDYFFYMTDGSLFWPTARNNILIVQSPAHFPKNSFKNKLKLFAWQKVFCYSNFVKNHFEKALNKKAQVIAPFVDINQFKPDRKQKLILSVGRFFSQPHDKKHEFLIKVFRDIHPRIKDWRLVIAGSFQASDEKKLIQLKKQANGAAISIKANLNFVELKKLYSQAAIYWHATGFGEDVDQYPAKAEHFGITTLEAMASGAVPVVINQGGLSEIVDHQKNGLTWQTETELKDQTIRLIKSPIKLKKLSIEAQKRAQNYSKENFFKNLETQLNY